MGETKGRARIERGRLSQSGMAPFWPAENRGRAGQNRADGGTHRPYQGGGGDGNGITSFEVGMGK